MVCAEASHWKLTKAGAKGARKNQATSKRHETWDMNGICMCIYIFVCVRIYQKIIYHMYIYIYEWDDIIQNYTKLSILENWATHSLNFTKHHLDSSSCMFVN